MTKTETAKILSIISIAYQRFKVDKKGIKLKFWYEMLKDYDYKLVQIAVKKLIAEKPFVPTIADIRRSASEIKYKKSLTPAEAWGEVMKAIRKYGHRSKKKALEDMAPLVAKTVNHMGWREICTDTKTGVIRGQFLKMYEQLEKRRREERVMPKALEDEIRKIGNATELISGVN